MADRLKILHVAALPGLGGLERRLLEYVERAQDGNEHVLCAIDPSAGVQGKLDAMHSPVHVTRRRFKTDIRLLCQIGAVVRREAPDIIYCRGFTAAFWTALNPLVPLRTPVIRGEHGSLAFSSMRSLMFERMINARVRLIVANSKATATEILTRLNPADRKVRVVYYGLDIEEFAAKRDPTALRTSLGIPAGAPVVGMVANFHPWKDQMTLVEAVPAVLSRVPSAIFVLVGSSNMGTALDECKSCARELGVAGALRFTGSREDARSIIQACNVFVLTSVYESFGTVLVEAALCGVPAIAARVGGIPEIVEHGKTGVLVDPGLPFPRPGQNASHLQGVLDVNSCRRVPPMRLDAGTLGKEIADLLLDPLRARAMGEAASRSASERFTFQRYVADLNTLYHEVAGR